MAMYYQGSSEIQADTLQTLYLMNPNCVGYSDSTQHQSNMLFFNSAATNAHGLNSHAPPQLVGLPQSHDLSRSSPILGHQENIPAPRLQYNIWNLIDQSANVNQTSTHQALSLSLSAAAHQTGGGLKPLPASDYQDFPAGQKNCSSLSHATTDSNGGNTMQSVIMGSKYLKAAQELLDEVANVGKENKNDRNKAKLIKESNCTDVAATGGGGEIGEKSGGGAELTTAQRQEIQMKKAKLSTMLDEVEQRYRQYHHQMQIVVASFEQAAGIGTAKSYTQLALKTILKQFRCLKCTISAQIRALSRSLGEEEEIRFVDHHQLRRQQLGMMHNSNAWRPQRGLPERAVSVLRAWLFEHFLHPYPKDSDKHMLAKQTGLSRSQVSNWFINARVRLWKPMVEEMYLEEMKNQEQITSHNSTKPGPDTESPKSLKFNPGHENDNHLNAALQSHQHKLILNLTENISANSPTGSSLQPRSSFSHVITSLNMKNLPEKNPKKPRNETHDNSPSSILSGADMEMKAVGDQTSKGFMKFSNARESYISMAANIGDQQMASMGLNFQGNNNINSNNSKNNFSLSLALPPSETSSHGTHHQQNFLSRRKFHEFGTRIEQSGVESGGINNQAGAGYEILDFQNRKPFPEIII